MTEDILPVGKLDMTFLSGLLARYTAKDERVTVGAKIGEDAAVIDFGDRYLVTKTNPITFATNEIGWYVVNVCVNNMVVRGVRPRWMLNCILLPEGKTTPHLVEDIFRQIHEASQQVDLLVIGGHTEVTYGLDRPIIAGHLIGEVDRQALVVTSGAQVGDTILITKALGIEGTAIIASELAETLSQKGYPAAFIRRAQNFLYEPGISVYKDALTAADTGNVQAMTDATEGGLATALHELAGAAEVGVLIEADQVPLFPETKQLCDEFGLDSLGLIASGMLIMTAAPDKVADLQQHMAAAGVPCTPIGQVTPAETGLRLSRAGQVTDLPYFAADELTKVL
jgi:hydrogenase expression/formation protein HypE